MRTFDLSPLYKSAIGFDQFANWLDEVMTHETQPAFPPYNIELIGDDKYRITMAVAGFNADELELEINDDVLKVTGHKAEETKEQEPKRQFLHQGIAERSFEHHFRLADHVKVVAADLENGLLHVSLEREIPEALKPRKIEITANKDNRLLKH